MAASAQPEYDETASDELVAQLAGGGVVSFEPDPEELLDTPVLLVVVGVAITVTLLATYLAARRALAIEPVEAMRAL